MPTRNGTYAVYPGTFDPLTNGHISLVRRARLVFGSVVLAVAKDTHKKSMFTLEERVEMAREALSGEHGVSVEGFEGLLVDYAKNRGARVIVRGLRAVSDFDFEFQMALMNRRMAREVETVFLMTDFKWLYISSTIIKEAARAGGDIRGLVPDVVLTRLYERFGRELPEPGQPR